MSTRRRAKGGSINTFLDLGKSSDTGETVVRPPPLSRVERRLSVCPFWLSHVYPGTTGRLDRSTFKFATTSTKSHHYLTPLQQQVVIAIYFIAEGVFGQVHQDMTSVGLCRLE